MSFNLRYWNNGDGEYGWPERRESVAEVILQNKPLIFGTQEGLLPMLQDLDGRIPAYDRIGEGRWEGDENEYNAIYYRRDELDMVGWNQFWLSETPALPGSKSWDSSLPRICTWGIFRHRSTQEEFAFFNTHLDHSGEEAREKGTLLIWQEISRYIQEGVPCILTGDFNCKPGSAPINFLRSQLLDALHSQGKGDVGTSHEFKGVAEPGPIDYIFTTNNVTILDADVLEGKVKGVLPSDHFPIIATIDLSEGVETRWDKFTQKER